MRFRDEYLNGRQDFESEMLSEVAEAVYAEDLDRARRALDDLHRAGSDATAELLRRAKASACGRPQGRRTWRSRLYCRCPAASQATRLAVAASFRGIGYLRGERGALLPRLRRGQGRFGAEARLQDRGRRGQSAVLCRWRADTAGA